MNLKEAMRWIGRIVSRLALLIASVLLAIAVAEIGLRLFIPQTLLRDPEAFVPDRVLGKRLIPGFRDVLSTPEYNTRWEINQGGHRGPEVRTKVPGGYRVALLGDSFTFGYGVEEHEAYPRVLEAILDARAPGAETINLGVGGYGTGQEVAWLREQLGRGLEPDLVVMGFYVGNDISDAIHWFQRHGAGPAGDDPADATEAAPPVPPTERLRRWLGARLHLYSFLSDRGDWLLVKLGIRGTVYFVEVEVLRSDLSPAASLGWQVVKDQLGELRKLGEQAGFQAVVMLIPMRHQVVPASWESVNEYYRHLTGDRLHGFDLDLPSRRLAEISTESGLPLMDLTGPFRSAEDPARLYFRRDQHWTRDGHALAAQLLAGFILERSLVAVRRESSGGRGPGGAPGRD